MTWTPGASRLTLVAGGDLMLASGAGHHGAKAGRRGRAARQRLGGARRPRGSGRAGAARRGAAVTLAVDTSAFPGPA